MLLKTSIIFATIFISATFASIKSPEETIKDESKKMLHNFVNKYLEKFEDKIAEAQTALKEYTSALTSENDGENNKFTDIFKHFNLQSLSIKSMKKVMEDLKESISLTDEETTLKSFKDEMAKLKKAGTKAAKFLTGLKEDGLKESFEKIYKLFEEHKNDLELFENVLENPAKIPKQSILSETSSKSTSEFVASKKYMIGFKCGEGEYSLIACEKGEELPFKRTVQIPRTPLEYFTGYSGGENDTEIVGRNPIKLPEEAFAYEITLEVNTENELSHNVKKILLDNSRFAKDLENMVPSKSPVIGFMGELSFIYVNDGKKGYKTLKSWNGNLGKELYISFGEKKSKFFEKAIESFKSTCNSVVHNVLEAMSINSEAIPTFKSIGYNLTSDSNNEVLFEYNNFDGTKKSESPSSLMTLVLKEHLKVIKEEIGEKPSEIALFIFDSFKEEEKKRVMKGLEASCETLKLKCNFVESD